MISLKISIPREHLTRISELDKAIPKVLSSSRKILYDELDQFHWNIIIKFMSGKPGLNIDSGKFIKALEVKTKNYKGIIEGSLLFNYPISKYWKGDPRRIFFIQVNGGTIYPTKAKSLAIPFPGIRKRPRDYVNATIIHRRGRAFIATVGKRGSIRYLFNLVPKVVIPRRIKWEQEIIKTEEQITRRIIESIEQGVLK